MGCLVIMILTLIAMPLVGLYLILRRDGDDETKAVGWIFLIVGCMIWLYVMIKSSG